MHVPFQPNMALCIYEPIMALLCTVLAHLCIHSVAYRNAHVPFQPNMAWCLVLWPGNVVLFPERNQLKFMGIS